MFNISFLFSILATAVPNFVKDILDSTEDGKFLVAISVLAIVTFIMAMVSYKTTLRIKRKYFILIFYLIIVPFTAIRFIPWPIGIGIILLLIFVSFGYQKKERIKIEKELLQ